MMQTREDLVPLPRNTCPRFDKEDLELHTNTVMEGPKFSFTEYPGLPAVVGDGYGGRQGGTERRKGKHG